MPAIEFISAIAIAYIGAIYHPFNTATDVNTAFAQRVDAVESCWYRIDGEMGSYGDTSSAIAGPRAFQEPSPANDYSLDLLCRYRMVDGVVTRL